MKNNDAHLIVNSHKDMIKELQDLCDSNIAIDTEEGLMQAQQTAFYQKSQTAISLDLRILPAKLALLALAIAESSNSITYIDARSAHFGYKGEIAAQHLASFPKLKYVDMSDNILQTIDDGYIKILDALNKSSSLKAVILKNNFAGGWLWKILYKSADDKADVENAKHEVNNLFISEKVLPSLPEVLQNLIKEYAYEKFSYSLSTFILEKEKLVDYAKYSNTRKIILESALPKQQAAEESLTHHLEEIGLSGTDAESVQSSME